MGFFRFLKILGIVLGAAFLSAGAVRADPYEDYVRGSEDFRRVKQDRDWAWQAFPGWTFMPWTWQWNIGYTEESGRWSVEHGYNGAFIDRGGIATENSPTGKLDWINRFQLRFYMDHAADKGLLHLWDGDKVKPHLDALHGTGIRPVPLNEATRARLEDHLRRNIAAVKSSPWRAAYALDDEPSWGHFIHPAMWQITDDAGAYPRWLREVYGENAPVREKWISYEDIRNRLTEWSIAEFDASPLMNQWSFNDSLWANTLGGLVEYANSLDPATPCGLVGGQAPSAFGGYDYAKLMRKVQFIESYNLGSSQAIIRSFNPGNALPAVTTSFHQSSADDVWQTWYYLAHGNRGHIGWVEGWFEGQAPQPWHAEVAPAYREAGQKIGPLMKGAGWKHDGVALYYSHASIQLGWILDAQAHGKTWINRNEDARLSSSVHVRHAWENMLRDSGLQYNYLSYVDVIREGIPGEYKVLILPACLCLSDAEARRIRDFCRRGGTVIADYLPGLWDQHGKGRAAGGVLDDMFGVRHDPALKAGDIFGNKGWVEVDQDTNYSWKSPREFLTNQNTCLLHGSGYHQAVRSLPVQSSRPFGAGRAVLMNLSPQWYNVYRTEGAEPARRRQVFMEPVLAAGSVPWVRLAESGGRDHGYEITYWNQPASGPGGKSRTLLFVCLNPEIRGTDAGGGNSVGLKTGTVPVWLEFSREIHDLKDERSGQSHGPGRRFPFNWKQNEAIVVSFGAS